MLPSLPTPEHMQGGVAYPHPALFPFMVSGLVEHLSFHCRLVLWINAAEIAR